MNTIYRYVVAATFAGDACWAYAHYENGFVKLGFQLGIARLYETQNLAETLKNDTQKEYKNAKVEIRKLDVTDIYKAKLKAAKEEVKELSNLLGIDVLI